MRRTGKKNAALAAGLLLVILLAVGVGLEGPRSAIVRSGLSIYLNTRGLHLQRGDLRLGGGELRARDLVIAERNGPTLFSAAALRVRYSFHGTSAAIEAVDVQRPYLAVRREANGTFNLTNLFGTGPAGPAGPAKQGPPMRMRVTVRDGRVDMLNPTSPLPIARGFTLSGLNVNALIDQGRRSHGDLAAVISAAGVARPLRAVFVENDLTRLGTISAHVTDVPLAPIVDLLVNTPAFVVEHGRADVAIEVYALGWAEAAGPAWQVSADIALRDGALKVVPLLVPARELSGKLHYSGGSLSLDGVTGTAAGVPLLALGSLQILPSARLAVRVDAQGPAERVRKLLAFSRSLPLGGTLALQARVSGPVTNPHVRVGFVSAAGLRFGGGPAAPVAGTLYYHHGHVTLTDVAADYAGLAVGGGGDMAVAGSVPTGQFVFTARGASDGLPVLANLNPSGHLEVLATLAGPLAKIHGTGYAQTTGASMALRTAFSGGPAAFSVGPLIARAGTGELFGGGAVERDKGARLDGQLVARSFPLAIMAGSRALPGVMDSPISLPSVSGIVDGSVALGGTKQLPTIGMDVRAHELVVAGKRLGEVALRGVGDSGQVRIASAMVSGPDAQIDASGVVNLPSRGNSLSATLSGTGAGDLAALSGSASLTGRLSGPFSAAFGAGQWLATASLQSSNASVDGFALSSVDAMIGSGSTGVHLYSGIAGVAGGVVGASGDLPGPDSSGLTVFARDIDARALRSAGVPLQSGTISGLGTLAGTLSAPQLTAAASLRGGALRGYPLAGDVDADYDGRTLAMRDSRASWGANSVAVRGSIVGLGGGRPPSSAVLALAAAVDQADLASLSASFLPKSTALTGNVYGAVRIGGTIGTPSLGGVMSADAGTLRGVPFEDLRASVRASGHTVGLSRGGVRVGTSQLRFSGTVAPQAVDLSVQSPHLDLSDANDFFEGRDVFDGVGQARLELASSAGGVHANGYVRLEDAQFAHLPLGTVGAAFSTVDRAIVVDVHQQGAIGSTTLRGDVTFAPSRGTFPAFNTARYDAQAQGRDIDIGILAALLNAQDAGIAGKLSVEGRAQGSAGRLSGVADFRVRDAIAANVPIRQLDGSLRSDGSSIDVPRLTVALDAATVEGRGRYGPGGRVQAHATVTARDLSSLSTLLKSPGALSGAALATLDLDGTRTRPRLRAALSAGPGALRGIAYDTLSAAAAYAPGRVNISGATLQLAKKSGAVSLVGSIPVRLAPFGIGPAAQSIALQLKADDVDLSTFNPLLGDAANLGGKFNAQATASGRAGSPELAGSASLANASVHSRFDSVPITGISANAAFAHDSLTLNRLHGTLGRGSLDVRATARLVPSKTADAPGFRYSAAVALKDATANIPGYFNGVVNGSLNLSPGDQAPSLTGTVALSDTQIPFASILALATGRKDSSGAPPPIVPGVPPLRRGHTIVYGGALYGNEPHVVKATPPPTGASAARRGPPPIDLDVIAQANKDVKVTGIVDVTTMGSVAVVGTTAAPQLAGAFYAVRGQVGAFGTNFRVARGTVTFDPDQGLLPTIDAQGNTYTSNTAITVTVSGRVDHLNIDLQSDPSLPRDQIIALLLHIPQLNSALAGGTSGGSAQNGYGQVAQNLLNAQLSSRLLSPLTNALAQSLDISEIDLTFDAQGQANLQLRKQFGARTYAIYSNTFAIPASQSVGFAYDLTDVLAIEFLQNVSPIDASQLTSPRTATINIRYRFR